MLRMTRLVRLLVGLWPVLLLVLGKVLLVGDNGLFIKLGVI